jgi:protocatechuate 3,4-dioxygenase beta subunit
VVADDTGEPLPNVRIAVTGVASGAPVVLTDAAGRFTLLAPPGHGIVASKSGYARSELPPAPAGAPIEIRLRRGAAISGRVIDEHGEPVLGARVTAELVSASPPRFTTAATTDSDDRGEYRLASLPDGTFVVAVGTVGTATIRRALGNNRFSSSPAFHQTYYPVGTREEAEVLPLSPGDHRSGIDFVLPTSQSGRQPFSAASSTGVSPLLRPQDDAERATGRVEGRIVGSDAAGLPYAQVVLTMRGMNRGVRVVKADEAGRFEFAELPAGSFRVAASKPGYFPVTAGEPSAPSIDLADDEARDGIEISLVRWGTLTGRVFDEYGDPLQGASIQLLQVRYEAGRRRLVGVGPAPRLTDDFGAYRLYGLAPGQYMVSAAIGHVSSAEVPGYARSYFPGTAMPAEAYFVSIGPAQEVAGIDIALSRARTARVAGRVLNAAREPTMGGSLMLMPSRRSAAVTSVPVGARILPSGIFEAAATIGDRHLPHPGGRGSFAAEQLRHGEHSSGRDLRDSRHQRAATIAGDARATRLGPEGDPRQRDRRHRPAAAVRPGRSVAHGSRGGADGSCERAARHDPG